MAGPATEQVPRTLLTRGRLRRWGTAILLASWGLQLYLVSTPGPFDREGVVKGGDFHHFYVLGTLAAERRGEALYDPRAQSIAVTSAVSSDLESWFPRPAHGPQVAMLFVPLAKLPFVWAWAAFLAVTLLLYAGCVQALLRLFPPLWSDTGLVWLLALAAPALWYLVRFGQTTALGLVCVTAALVALANGRPALAGAAIGGLFYKPQFGLVFGIVWLLSGEWRIVLGALTSITAQLTAAWLWFGTPTMRAYLDAAWGLILDRSGAEPIPQHLHTVRGFLGLLLPRGGLETTLYVIISTALLVLAWRAWRSRAPLPMRYAQLLLVTVLTSMHLTVYDLVLLLPVFLAVGSWLVSHGSRHRAGVMGLLLAGLYVSPVLGASVTYFTRVQLSVPLMMWLAWRLDRTMRASA